MATNGNKAYTRKCNKFIREWKWKEVLSSGKHVREMNIPLNPILLIKRYK